MQIASLPVKTLVKVLAQLRGGEIGFDPYRDPRTKSKDALLAFILAGHDNDAIIRAVSHVQGEFAAMPVTLHYEDINRQRHSKTFECEADKQAWLSSNPSMRGINAPLIAPAFPPAIAKGKIAESAPVAVPTEATQLAQLLAKLAGTGALDEAKVRDICDSRAEDYVANILAAVNKRQGEQDAKIEALTNRKPVVERIEIIQKDKPMVEIKERVNAVFHEVLAMASAYPNIMLVGPAGCGKTHLAGQVAKALGKSFATLSGSAGISESHFAGRLLPTGQGGKFEYTESPFIAEYRKDDGCFLIDEFDALDPNCVMICNGATANGGFTVEARKAGGLDPYVPRGARSLLMASANTYGQGADTLYTARFQQDASANDRWYFIPMDYDRDLEASLASEELCAWVWSLREEVAAHKLRRVVSTRMLQKAAAARSVGRPMREVRERLLAGWTPAERTKCGV